MPDLDPITVQARSVLLDAIEALQPYRNDLIVVGAQAIYLRTGSATVAIAEATKDSDFVIDPRHLPHEPLIEDAMSAANFKLNIDNRNPGAWVSPTGIPVDLMVPAELSGVSGQHRGARIPPHSPKATRRTVGLEACVVDYDEMLVPALAEDDTRKYIARVAGVAALIIAKVHKIHERIDVPHRLNDKDAHDVHRLLVASDDLRDVGANFRRLSNEPVCAEITRQAVEWLPSMFADGPHAIGSMMAGRSVMGLGDPDFVSASTAALAQDLLDFIGP
ncbi:hypothetical protein GBO17_13230 [Mycobacterium avium subsp. hominissuis]|uniref:hypothetical protein n=1 Tax=Mycobacterium avium TaxID=1764 RepID=UPI001CC62701|nr:hypothetical protein [Mycobacterium avium]MBZ4559891.1 hypothetical protein [Mycobacterium avium subsp. hominissuis]MBZ4569427.1 hypothetical protein [Mycobacterium avium subsp. hominissuis]MBZ4589304.1 hypothetical protein [Mycobacterium avium subsp. hominissuis]MBZ4626428.1 hypothetical protein [Mycobacterium avium subsp. hominissuis]